MHGESQVRCHALPQELVMVNGRARSCYACLTNFIATEFMQYRSPVGRGPSSKTCPRCASQRAHKTSVRDIPRLLSAFSTTFCLAIGCQKLGQPVPESNLVSEL